MIVVVVLATWSLFSPGRGCISGPGDTSVCALTDMARPTASGDLTEGIYNLSKGPLEIHAARNEVVAFQLGIRNLGFGRSMVRVEISDLEGPDGARIPSNPYTRRFLAHFVNVDPGGYTWGPKSDVLPWPDAYPDALVPFRASCNESEVIIEEVPVPGEHGDNQLVWVDLYVPRHSSAGQYKGVISLEADGEVVEVPLSLTVWDATLPDEVEMDAIAEIYDPYKGEGLDTGPWDHAWQRMAQCYQKMAHRHRMVFVERTGQVQGPSPENPEPDPQAWEGFDQTWGPALTGDLFRAQNGYVGPGEGVPVSVWRTPWPQPWNGHLDESLDPQTINYYEDLARVFTDHAREQGWIQTRFFAYLFDEVDGPTDEEAKEGADAQRASYVKRVHHDMDLVQQALDRGSKPMNIDLLWTSHAKPSMWTEDPALDLRGKVRLWSPNASAADPAFFEERVKAGERVWFYHAGHPSVGIHAINASGVELRSWGVLAARYGLQGNFMWALNLGDPDEPYKMPSYKAGDDRFGNGTLVYPGAQLEDIGHVPSAGPVPSMRLKAWRRGLQDAALARLAQKEGYKTRVDLMLRNHIPKGLGEAEPGKPPTWPRDHARWEALRMDLLKMASH